MGVRISELPDNRTFTGAELVPIVHCGETTSSALSSVSNYYNQALLVDSGLSSLTGTWQSTYTTVNACSAGWEGGSIANVACINVNNFFSTTQTFQQDLSVVGNTTLGDNDSDITRVRGIAHLADSSQTCSLSFGADVNLYRSASNVLKTDDSYIVAGDLSIDGNTTLGNSDADQTTIRGTACLQDSSASDPLQFGADVNLYRSEANILRTDDSFTIGTNLSVVGNTTIDGNTTLGNASTDTSDVRGRVRLIDSSVTYPLSFGSDVNLYRSASNFLKTDDSFCIGTNLNVDGCTTLGNANTDTADLRGRVRSIDSSATYPLSFGADVNLFRSEANILRTDDSFTIGTNLSVVNSSTLRCSLRLTDSSNTTPIYFGDSNDAVLYKSSSDTLKTNGFIVDRDLNVNGCTFLGNEEADTADIRGRVRLIDSSATYPLSFGADVNLYRSASNVLKTDDSFCVGTNLSVFGTIDGANADWDNAYTTVCSCSASWNAGGSLTNVAYTNCNNFFSITQTLQQDLSVVGNTTINGNTTLGNANTDTSDVRGRVRLIDSSATYPLSFGADVNLYRSEANILRTDDSFTIGTNLSVVGNTTIDGNTTLGNADTDQTTIRGIACLQDSSVSDPLQFGSDVSLYRDCTVANGCFLRTDNNLCVNGSVSATNIYANTLYTVNVVDSCVEGDLNVTGGANICGNTTLGNANTDTSDIRGRVRLIDSSATYPLSFGADVNLYRSEANILRTDDSFTIGTNLSVVGNTTIDGNTTLGNSDADQTTIRGIACLQDSSVSDPLLFGSDVNLFRSEANILRTDDSFTIGTNLSVVGNTTINGNTTLGNANSDCTRIYGTNHLIDSSVTYPLSFGSDVNLYRSEADILRTDDSFTIGTNLSVVGNTTIDGNTTLGNANTDTSDVRGRVRLIDSSVTYPLSFGSDVNLFRSEANILRTDDSFTIGTNLSVVGNTTIDGNTTLGNADTDQTTIRGIACLQDSSASDPLLFGADVNLYRSEANILRTDDSFTIGTNLSVVGNTTIDGNTTLGNASTDTSDVRGCMRLIDSSATHPLSFGADINLFRSQANILRTDDSFTIGTNLSVVGNTTINGNTTLGNANSDCTRIYGTNHLIDSSATYPLSFGADVNLYRGTANTLKTDDSLQVELDFSVLGNTTLGDSDTDQTTIRGIACLQDSSASDPLQFGTDVNLFRSEANILRTDDSFTIGTNLSVVGNTTLGDSDTDQTTIRGIACLQDSSASDPLQFGSDVNLYRSSSNVLKTDDSFCVVGDLITDSNTTLGNSNTDTASIRGTTCLIDSSSTIPLLFGNDVNLYRNNSNILKTDDTLVVGCNLRVCCDATIAGNLSVYGEFTYLDTIVSVTSALSVINAGTGPGVTVIQSGTETVATFIDKEGSAVTICDTGSISIGQQVSACGTLSIAQGYRSRATGNYSISLGQSSCAVGNNAFAVGINNNANGVVSTVGGGRDNSASCNCTVVGGGCSNTASGNYAVIVGGKNNTGSGVGSFVGGGTTNAATGSYTALGGGCNNSASGTNSVIGGGCANTSSNSYSTVAGGRCNTAAGFNSFIGGGFCNSTTLGGGVVAGGISNCADAQRATVAGGSNNLACNLNAFVGGGCTNTASGQYSTVTGGKNNTTATNCSFIGGGFCNTVCSGTQSIVVGGECNTVIASHASIIGGLSSLITSSGCCSVIAGGACNSISACFNIIGSGISNQGLGVYSFIGSGASNINRCGYSFIGTGNSNNTCSNYSAIVNGLNNNICLCGLHSTIGGGCCNTINREYGFIGSGRLNFIESSFSTIVGGLSNCYCCSSCSFIGAGVGNCIHCSSVSFVGSGNCNKICFT